MAWYSTAYRRNVVDMHIADWDERFLKDFDPDRYVEMLVRSKVQSTVLYANSCVGLCYYPTRVGRMHPGTLGRNLTAEVLERCHRHGIAVVLYYALVFDNYAWSRDADWRVIDADGNEALPPHKGPIGHRFKICCPNAPGYRQYVQDLTTEICETFDEFEGIRFDMAFWPTVCYCRHCRSRYHEETGFDMPRTIDWYDRRWVALQRCRERWLVEFAGLATDAARRAKPGITVEHQASTFIQSWRSGVPVEFSGTQDFLQGDFYGDKIQGILARKLFYNLSANLPFGFETSYCITITNHTAKKPTELLEVKAFSAIADGGAFVYIDGIDCEGTLNPRLYDVTGSIFAKTVPYERYIGGEMCQDVAIYFSCTSKFDFDDSGKDVMDVSAVQSLPHVVSCTELCRLFTEQHVPFGVITRRNLHELNRHSVIVLPNVLMMDQQEAEAIRDFVSSGGCVVASKYTSLFDVDGTRREDFSLGDVFGAVYQGMTKESFTYIAPVADHEALFDYYTASHPLALPSRQTLIRSTGSAEVLGELVLPWSDPAEEGRFASQHSNPPAVHTGSPAIMLNSYGSGRAVYVTGDLPDSQVHGFLMMNLVRLLHPTMTFEIVAPKALQCTAFHQREHRRYMLSMVNHQEQLPNIPISGVQVSFCSAQSDTAEIRLLPDGESIPFRKDGERLSFELPEVSTFAMVSVGYQP